MISVLVLGGTGEGRQLAAALADRPDVRVISSLAGRVRAPLSLPGEVRVGGFGGVDGLASWLGEQRIDAVVDATHPFAARMSANAVAAAVARDVPLVVLRRPGWEAGPGDRWIPVPTLAAAAAALDGLGERVLLTTGRQGLAAFAGCARPWFLARSVDPPEGPVPPRLEVLLDRGPFTVDGEIALMTRHRIDVVVTKNSGGDATAAKLVAARQLDVPVVMVDRPAPPSGASIVETVDAAVAWLDRQAPSSRSRRGDG